MGAHRQVNPESLLPARGFSHAVVTAPGTTIYYGGMDAETRAGEIESDRLVDQLDVALANLVTALGETGATAEDLVSMQVFVTDADEYRASLRELGQVWKRRLGAHYPAMALFEITGLFHPAAKIEIMAVAVIPE